MILQVDLSGRNPFDPRDLFPELKAAFECMDEQAARGLIQAYGIQLEVPFFQESKVPSKGKEKDLQDEMVLLPDVVGWCSQCRHHLDDLGHNIDSLYFSTCC